MTDEQLWISDTFKRGELVRLNLHVTIETQKKDTSYCRPTKLQVKLTDQSCRAKSEYHSILKGKNQVTSTVKLGNNLQFMWFLAIFRS